MQQNVIDTVSAMTAALERGDIDTVMSFYVDDAVVAFEPGEPVRGEPGSRPSPRQNRNSGMTTDTRS